MPLWAQAGLPLAHASTPAPSPAPAFVPSYNPSLVVTKDGIKARDTKAVLLDTRSPAEFAGLESVRVATRAHCPSYCRSVGIDFRAPSPCFMCVLCLPACRAQMGNPRAGAIPGAVNWDYQDILQLVQGSKEAFVKEAKARGIAPDSSVITYCQGGMRAVGSGPMQQRFGAMFSPPPPLLVHTMVHDWGMCGCMSVHRPLRQRCLSGSA